jgi:DNA-binding NarL/FixJ family response regulator
MPRLVVHGVARMRDALDRLRRGDDLDLLLCDQRLPDGSGLALLREAAVLRPEVARMLISGSDDPDLPDAARAAGANAFLHKSGGADRLLQALQAVLIGEPWFDSVPAPRAATALPALTPRAREALQWLVAGKTNREISERMGIGERAVKLHLSAAFQALGVGRRTEALLAARRLGLVPDEG